MSPARNRNLGLKQMKAIALAFLLGAVALLVLAHWHGREGAWGWVGAFAEAATIGALADWFAVVALFRHPFGIPIAHTAIIPRNKARIADALATFVADNFLAREQILRKLSEWNPALRLGQFLSTPQRLAQLSRQLQAWLTQSLAALDEPAFEREILAVVRQQLQGWNAARTGAQLLRALTQGDHHQRVLNAGLTQIAHWLDQPTVREVIAAKLVAMARREFPKVLWLSDTFGYTEELGEALSNRLANAILDEVQAVLRTPEHPLRQRYSIEAAKLMENLENDAQLQETVADFKQRLLDSPVLQDYVRHLWQRLRQWLHQDLARDDAISMAQVRHYAARLGQRLQHDPIWQQAANAQLRIAAEHIAGQLRSVAPLYIRQTVESWDTSFLVDEIERSVGRDLQFIRLNGTLIGGLAGVALYAVFHLPLFR